MTESKSAAVQDRYDIDGRYAWQRLCLSLSLATVGGIGLWSVVVALPAVEAEFGVDRSDASLPYTATMLAFAVGGVLMGRLADRFGIRVPMILAALLMGGGYVLVSFAGNLWEFVAAQSLLIGIGASASFGALVADVSLWFRRRRGIAVAIVASGNYLAGSVWPSFLQYGIDTIGWRGSHVIIGIACVVLMVPLALALRRRPPVEAVAAGSTGIRSAHERVETPHLSPTALQVLLVMAGLACCIAMSMPQVHLVAYCVDLGYGPARGAEMLAAMLGLGIVSRLTCGVLADRIGGVGILLLSSSLQCLALFFYLPFDGLMSLYVISALFGLSQGGIVPSYALIVRQYFPASEAGFRISLVVMATIVGMAIGGWLSGLIYDLTGSYQVAFMNGIAFNLLNMSLAAWLLLGGRFRRAGAA